MTTTTTLLDLPNHIIADLFVKNATAPACLLSCNLIVPKDDIFEATAEEVHKAMFEGLKWPEMAADIPLDTYKCFKLPTITAILSSGKPTQKILLTNNAFGRRAPYEAVFYVLELLAHKLRNKWESEVRARKDPSITYDLLCTVRIATLKYAKWFLINRRFHRFAVSPAFKMWIEERARNLSDWSHRNLDQKQAAEEVQHLIWKIQDSRRCEFGVRASRKAEPFHFHGMDYCELWRARVVFAKFKEFM